MKEIIQKLIELSSRREPGALASVVSAKGSLPMSRRSRMLVCPGGAQIGTVGGGCLEAEVHSLGGQAIRSRQAWLRRFTLTESKAGAEGLNCGGTVEILVEPVGSSSALQDERTSEVYEAGLRALEAREETVMATFLQGGREGAGFEILGKGLVGWKGLRAGSGGFDPASEPTPLLRYAVEEALGILGQDRSVLLEPSAADPVGSGRLFLEAINAPPTLYLFGGGHVSLAVASVARAAGFRVVVVDDRPAFANPDRFPEAEQTVVLPMHDALSRLPIDRSSYIVAVTRGHQHDEPVIEQAIRTPAAYIGMIGSRRKVAVMWERLKSRGVSGQELARVHAPIGLSIGADSPGEIAVSIVAQLIKVRRHSGR